MINAKEFIKALNELEATKGISKESIIEALKEAMEKGFIKQLGIASNGELEEAKVRVDIDAKKGTIEMYVLKTVVEEVEDDFLEISLEDANENGNLYNIGDIYEIPVSTDELTKLTAQQVKSVLRQKIAEAEKIAIYEAYIDKKGEMIRGTVEKVDERSTIVNIGRTSVYLPNSHKIPGETFRIGETIRLYVVDVLSTTKGAQINVSRSDAGYLRRLFEEEITEIYDGIVLIKDIAREAGERAKVAVFTLDPNVDPIGACIGQNGTRIQKICGSLGNAKEKEKIDIIAYNENPGLFIIEALKPATVVGVKLDEENKRAIAVVKNNELSLAIGKRGVNARLAVRLTGWTIDIKELDVAMREGILFVSKEEILRQEELKKLAALKETSPVTELVVEEEISTEEEYIDNNFEEETIEEEVVTPITKTEVKVETTVEEETIEEEPVVEEETIETTTVDTSVRLADLEKELEDEKKRRERQGQGGYRRKKKTSVEEEEVEEESTVTTVDRSTYMSIYTDEELEEFEREEEYEDDYDDEDEIDYDDYDSYYDDDDR